MYSLREWRRKARRSQQCFVQMLEQVLRLQKARHWAQGADQMQGLEHYHQKDCRLVSPQMQMFDQMLGLAQMIQKDHHSGQKAQVVRRQMGREHQSQTSQTPSTLLSNQNPMSRIHQIAEYCCYSECRSRTQHSVVAVQNQYFAVAVGRTRRMQIHQYFADRKAWTAHQTSRTSIYLPIPFQVDLVVGPIF